MWGNRHMCVWVPRERQIKLIPNLVYGEKMKRTILVMLMTFVIIVTVAPVTSDSSGSTIFYYDGQFTTGVLPYGIATYDGPALGATCVSPGPYPYEFNLSESLHVYLQIRHCLYTKEGFQNNLTIYLDDVPVLEADAPLPMPDWYPGGDGIELIDLGTVAAGTHNITMSATPRADYYAMDWFKVLGPVYDVAVVNVVPANTQVYPTWTGPLEITVTVLNNGSEPANFTVTAYNDTTIIGTQNVTDLAPGTPLNRTFSWTVGGAYGDHTIKANATLADDVNPGNNEKSVTVRVVYPGDCTDNGFVDLADLQIFLPRWFTGP